MSGQRLFVVGIGHDGPSGLTTEARACIDDAGVLAGGQRQLGFFPHCKAEKILLNGDLERFVSEVRRRYSLEKTVVLATGDPLCFGIGKALLQAIPREDVVVLPSVSSIQLAFARIKESWDDARIFSVHGRPLETLTPVIQAGAAKIAVLTDAKNNPAAIGELLRGLGVAHAYTMWVCENLGGSDERIGRFSCEAVGSEAFSPLNVVVLIREKTASLALANVPLVGIPEEFFLHRAGPHGMITRRDIRLLTLASLELCASNVLWDLGAGSGSVAIEASRLAHDLRVFAVEHEEESFERLRANVARLSPGRVVEVRGEAPACLADLPDPDAVFIGGNGGKLTEIMEHAARRLRPGGRIVLNCITLETMMTSWQQFLALGLQPGATSIQLAHSRPLGRSHGMCPENPITIVRARKP